MSLEDFQKSRPKVSQKGRSSVSAEVYGLWNKKQPFTPKNIPKSVDIEAALRDKLNQSFMFRSLEANDLQIVINAMEEVKFAKGDNVIKQGDDGDVLYFVFDGELDCHKLFPGKNAPTHLLTYTPGMSFGELALLYNTPRAASIVANTDAVLYSLDRECFNNIVKESAIKRRNKFDTFLSKVELLQELDQYERSKICDCLVPHTYKSGDYIIKEGESGNTFFFIESGTAYATKKNSTGSADRVFEYKANDYFGELALLKDIPRQASIIAQVTYHFSFSIPNFLRLIVKLSVLTDQLLRDFSVLWKKC